MDKALEKINELKQKLEELYIEKDNIEDKIDFKNIQKKQVFNSYNKLKEQEATLKNEKENIEYKQSNLKNWRNRQIIRTIIYILILETMIIVGLFQLLNPKTALLFISLFSSVAIPGCIWAGDEVNYKFQKKYLKEHKLEDVEKELAENNKKLNSYEKQLNDIERELSDSFNNQDEILNNIDLFESEVKMLEDIRSSVINEYTKDNQELDDLINKEYEKENQKQLIKKKDSNK